MISVINYNRYIDICYYIYFYVINLLSCYLIKLLCTYNFSMDLTMVNVKKPSIQYTIQDDYTSSDGEYTSDDENEIKLIDVNLLINSAILINNDYTITNITNNIIFLINKQNSYILVSDIMQYFTTAKYLNIQYYNSHSNKVIHKIIDLKSRYDIKNNRKCYYGKIEL